MFSFFRKKYFVIAAVILGPILLILSFKINENQPKITRSVASEPNGIERISTPIKPQKVDLPTCNPKDTWVGLFNFPNQKEKFKIRAGTTNLKGAEVITNLQLPKTIGPCKIPAKGNQLKVCLNELPPTYMNIFFEAESDAQITMAQIPLLERYCDKSPYKIELKLKKLK